MTLCKTVFFFLRKALKYPTYERWWAQVVFILSLNLLTVTMYYFQEEKIKEATSLM